MFFVFFSAETGGVVGGHEAAAHSRPYMALLAVTKADGATGYCGGFLLTREFVMTAAHCQARSPQRTAPGGDRCILGTNSPLTNDKH